MGLIKAVGYLPSAQILTQISNSFPIEKFAFTECISIIELIFLFIFLGVLKKYGDRDKTVLTLKELQRILTILLSGLSCSTGSLVYFITLGI